MIVWVLLIKIIINGTVIPYMAFSSQEACDTAKSHLPDNAKADCVAFAADVAE